ncbi:MAG: DUF2201 family putative metallopeptidase [Pseudomonas sp.]
MARQKTLDKAVVGLFQHKGSGFLAALYCGLRVRWDDTISTACTDGLELFINFDWFTSLSESMRVTLLAHEVWHVAFLHMARVGKRDFKLWNMATDYAINNMLLAAGYVFDRLPCGGYLGLLDPRFDGMSAEAIYDILLEENPPIDLPFGDDFKPLEGSEDKKMATEAAITAAVTRAYTVAAMTEPGSINDALKEMMESLLRPTLPWQTLLRRWYNDRSTGESSWARRNRRYRHVYMPYGGKQDSLTHLLFALDSSGSMSLNQLRYCNSELVGMKDQLNPKLTTVVSFDEEIRDTWKFTDDDLIGPLTISGRWGTDLSCVFDLVRETKPNGLIVLSDLECVIPEEIPGVHVLWLCLDNPSASVPYGTLLHIDTTSAVTA